MPLNMQENDEFPVEDEHLPPPIRRPEGPQGPALRTVVLIVLLVALIGGGGYLLYRFNIFGKRSASTVQSAPAQPSTLQNPWKADTAAQASAAPAPQVVADESPRSPAAPPAGAKEGGDGAAQSPALAATPGGDGRFALYISSYREQAPADEEASRWSAAGFSAYVEDTGVWHRVVLGRYADVAAAKKEAVRWKPALENGFWIAPLK